MLIRRASDPREPVAQADVSASAPTLQLGRKIIIRLTIGGASSTRTVRRRRSLRACRRLESTTCAESGIDPFNKALRLMLSNGGRDVVVVVVEIILKNCRATRHRDRPWLAWYSAAYIAWCGDRFCYLLFLLHYLLFAKKQAKYYLIVFI